VRLRAELIFRRARLRGLVAANEVTEAAVQVERWRCW
jgi:hypothetical protein